MSTLCRVLNRKPLAPFPARSLSQWTGLVHTRPSTKIRSRQISHRSSLQPDVDEADVPIQCTNYQDVMLIRRIQTFQKSRELLEADLKGCKLAPLLGMAIEMEKIHAVRWLLDRGADPNGWSHGPSISHLAHATTLLASSMTFDARKIFDMLLRYGAHAHGSGALWEAAKLGDITAVGTLLDRGADVNEIISYDTFAHQPDRQDPYRRAQLQKFFEESEFRTPLHAAVVNEHVEVVGFLLYKGADKTIEDSCGYTAVGLASEATFEDEQIKGTNARDKLETMLYYTPPE